eukprot:SAG22_NODE_1360_length_4622_cov_2.212912_5_plen_104_part_00
MCDTELGPGHPARSSTKYSSVLRMYILVLAEFFKNKCSWNSGCRRYNVEAAVAMCSRASVLAAIGPNYDGEALGATICLYCRGAGGAVAQRAGVAGFSEMGGP